MSVFDVCAELEFHHSIIETHIECYGECLERLLSERCNSLSFREWYDLFTRSTCPLVRGMCLSVMAVVGKTGDEARLLKRLIAQLPKSEVPKALRPIRKRKIKGPVSGLFT